MSGADSEAKHEKFPRKIILGVIILVVLVALAVGGYFFFDYQKKQELLNNPQAAAQLEAQTLVSEVGKLMALPSDEQPQIATVSDVTKLQDQPFFAKAQNGYKVLIYTKAKKAILYDPSEKKIIEVAPVNLADVSPTPAGPIVIALYNGTTVTGLTNTVEKELKDKGANVTVSSKTNAAKSTYTQTLVVDLTGSNQAAAAALAQLLGGKVGTLPAGETKPEGAEILVILGK